MGFRTGLTLLFLLIHLAFYCVTPIKVTSSTTTFVSTTISSCTDALLFDESFSNQTWTIENGNSIISADWAPLSGSLMLVVQIGDVGADANDYATMGYFFTATQTCFDLSYNQEVSLWTQHNNGFQGTWDIALAEDATTISTYIPLSTQPTTAWTKGTLPLSGFTGVNLSCIKGIVFRGHALDTWSQIVVDQIESKCPGPSTTTTIHPNHLRDLADGKNQWLGSAASYGPLVSNPNYQLTLSNEFNMLVPGNAMKWDALRPVEATFDYTQADAIMDFGQTHNMKARGHVLVWHSQLPNWLTSGGFDASQSETLMQTHIDNVITHFATKYPGQLLYWDVVNEAVDDSGAYRSTDSYWYTVYGNADYIKRAFEFARASANTVDPSIKLFYNDYNIEMNGSKGDFAYTMISNLLSQGTPIDGIGFQLHIKYDWPNLTEVESRMDQYINNLGLDVQFTEIDIRFEHVPSAAELTIQAQRYRALLEMCLARPKCSAFVVWDFSDKYSWIRDIIYDQDQPLPFDDFFQPKPAYWEMQAELLE